MRWVFWSSLILIAYTYCGYPAWLWLRSHVRRRPVKVGQYKPTISIVIVVRNEGLILERKLKNLRKLSYPAELREIVVVSDGSTDSTNEILNYHAADSRVRTVVNADSRGKAACLNDAIGAARGDLVVFTDARQEIEADAVQLLVETFHDPQVGCASGELMLGNPSYGENVHGMGLYWRIEKTVR